MFNRAIENIFSTLKTLQETGRQRDDQNRSKIEMLQRQLNSTTAKLEEINSSYEDLKNRGDLKLDELKVELETKYQKSKEKALKEQEEIRNKNEINRKNIEENYDKQIRRLENKINDLERVRDENIQKRVRTST